MIMNENKKTFFSINLDTSKINDELGLERTTNQMDLVLGVLNIKNNISIFKAINKNEMIFFFETDQRKRKGLIIKQCEKCLSDDVTFSAQGLTKQIYFLDIERYAQNFTQENNFDGFNDYHGNDLKVFDDRSNWYDWQVTLHNKIFNEDGSIKEPDPRKIYSITDPTGNSGKSSWSKNMVYKNFSEVGMIPSGSAAQLRSNIIRLGMKRVYIIDLARARAKDDSIEDILQICETLKNGLVQQSLFGGSGMLLMEPPHLVITSNFVLNYDLLSKDRWEIYKVNKRQELERLRPSEITRQLKNQQKDLIKDIEIKKLQAREIRKEVRKEFSVEQKN
jgi:hypothetical protein